MRINPKFEAVGGFSLTVESFPIMGEQHPDLVGRMSAR